MRKLLEPLQAAAARRDGAATVLALGGALLARHTGVLGDEVWTVHEHMLVAALDDLPAQLPLATRTLALLERRFGTASLRVRRLRGMLHEAQGEYGKAAEVYAAMLETDPLCVPAMKRRVALAMAQGHVATAIELLVAYLDVFTTDAEAWEQLSELYLARHMLPQAQFCLEELVLLEPQSATRQLKLASVLYTQGGVDKLLIAKKYFCRALELDRGSVRAMWGLKMCCKALADSKSREVEGARVAELDQFVTGLLLEAYKGAATAPVVSDALSSLAASSS